MPGARLRLKAGALTVRGTTTDNGQVRGVLVNEVEAASGGKFSTWGVKLTGLKPGPLTITAETTDTAGNVDKHPHRVSVVVE